MTHKSVSHSTPAKFSFGDLIYPELDLDRNLHRIMIIPTYMVTSSFIEKHLGNVLVCSCYKSRLDYR